MGTIWWMNRLKRCETDVGYECVLAWWDAFRDFVMAEARRYLADKGR